MTLFKTFDPQSSTLVGYGVSALLVSSKDAGNLQGRLAALGCAVDRLDELYLALESVLDGPVGYDLIVIDCDGLGGLSAGQRAKNLLRIAGRCPPVILVSRECGTQVFPNNRFEPVILRAPCSALSLRVGFEHAMQDRIVLARAG